MSSAWVQTAQALSLPGFALAAVIAALIAFIRVLPQLRRVQMENDASLRADLLKMKSEQDVKIAELQARLDASNERIAHLEKQLSAKDAAHDAHIADIEHSLRSIISNAESLILLIEANPDKALDYLAKFKELLAEHRTRLALKQGAREGALMAGGAE